MKYFWDPKGKKPALNADIARHRAERDYLDRRIEGLEGKSDPMSVSALRTYRHLKCHLQQSLADVVNRLGRRRK